MPIDSSFCFIKAAKGNHLSNLFDSENPSIFLFLVDGCNGMATDVTFANS